MSQATTWSVPTVGPATPTDYAARDNAALNALLSSNSGAAEPSYKVRGTIWEDTTSNQLKRWDGSAWRVIDANMAQATVKGRAASAGTGAPQDLSVTDLLTLLGFAQSLAGNGYVKIPTPAGILILQWTTVTGGSGTTSITWPVAFTTACYGAIGGTSSGAGGVVLSTDVFNITASGCSVGRAFSGGTTVAASGHSAIIFALGK